MRLIIRRIYYRITEKTYKSILCYDVAGVCQHFTSIHKNYCFVSL